MKWYCDWGKVEERERKSKTWKWSTWKVTGGGSEKIHVVIFHLFMESFFDNLNTLMITIQTDQYRAS